MSNDIKFCYKCGANIPEGSAFCPECGSRLDGSEDTRTEFTARPVRADALGPLPILIKIYMFIAPILAILVILTCLSAKAIIDMLQAYVDSGAIPQEYYDMLKAALAMYVPVYCAIVSIVLFVSALLARKTSKCVDELKDWNSAVTYCAAASAVLLLAVWFDILTFGFLAVAGFLMTYLLYSHKQDFSS